MTGHASLKDATEQLSPRTLPITDPVSTPPERESAENPVCPPRNSKENLSVPSSAREPLRLSTESSLASEYDQLSSPLRSPLLDSEPGLGPSGLDRIRSQPASRVFTLPNMSTSSVAPTQRSTSPPAPRSATSSRAASVYLPSTSNAPPPVVEDLHRFPTESLHSFSFTEQSGELLQTRQTFLKRSIDFMRDRLGLAHTAAQARANGGAEYQSMVDSLSKTGISEEQADGTDGSLLASQGRLQTGADQGRESSPPESRTFRGSRTGTRSLVASGVIDEHVVDDISTFPSPSPEDHAYSHEHDLKSELARPVLSRTFTDHSGYSLRSKLLESPSQLHLPSESSISLGLGLTGSAVHTHSSKWTPVSQAVFRTEDRAPWTILAANDLACLVFGVKQSEVRKLSILEIVQEERRPWLESKLQASTSEATAKTPNGTGKSRFNMSKALRMGGGVTAQLLSKPSSRQKAGRRAQTDDGFGSSTRNPRRANNAEQSKSRGVLLCGDVVPIQKRNGLKGSASLWVMEKRGGLIWVLEEITEHVAHLTYDKQGRISAMNGDVHEIWDPSIAKVGASLADLLPRVPASFEEIVTQKYFAARTHSDKNCIPMTIIRAPEGGSVLRASTFPHVAGMMVLSSSTLNIISSNSVFSAALFGYERPEGHRITELIPDFERLLQTLAQEDQVALVDGVVIPEQSFRRARALMALRDDKANAASVFLEPEGIPIRHRDGSQILVDIQMRIIKSETAAPEESRVEEAELSDDDDDAEEEIDTMPVTEIVYALWITFSRQTHAPRQGFSMDVAKAKPSLPQPQVGQPSPPPSLPSHSTTPSLDNNQAPSSSLSQELSEAASTPLAGSSKQPASSSSDSKALSTVEDSPKKKRTIDDYVILEEMGQGAYGQVKLARLKDNPSKKTVLKYVTKKRILVDTWTRDRRLGTVPLEIHVLDYLRRDGFRHPNIVEMEGFFEDDVNYYIEMVPHGLPGMDLFDYIELRANMDEAECRNIFKQVVDAIHHLHTKALVVHRDIKDENVILDGDGRIKLIDFGSAAYIKNGPFDVFVGTIDYAAPEVLQGKSYRGKEQDVWALGILLYTIVYKENPFYNVDEILDHPLRVPFLPFSEDCIDLIRKMLDRDVDNRLTITEVMNHPWLTAS